MTCDRQLRCLTHRPSPLQVKPPVNTIGCCHLQQRDATNSRTPYVTRHMSRVTRHKSHVTRRTSRFTHPPSHSPTTSKSLVSITIEGTPVATAHTSPAVLPSHTRRFTHTRWHITHKSQYATKHDTHQYVTRMNQDTHHHPPTSMQPLVCRCIQQLRTQLRRRCSEG